MYEPTFVSLTKQKNYENHRQHHLKYPSPKTSLCLHQKERRNGHLYSYQLHGHKRWKINNLFK